MPFRTRQTLQDKHEARLHHSYCRGTLSGSVKIRTAVNAGCDHGQLAKHAHQRLSYVDYFDSQDELQTIAKRFLFVATGVENPAHLTLLQRSFGPSHRHHKH
jgi:hypothetical protein